MTTGVAQQAAHGADGDLHGVARVRAGLLAPERLDERVGADTRAGHEQQARQQELVLLAQSETQRAPGARRTVTEPRIRSQDSTSAVHRRLVLDGGPGRVPANQSSAVTVKAIALRVLTVREPA